MGTAFPVWGTRAENAVKLVVALKLAALNRMSNVVRFGAFKCLILTANEQGATSNTSNETVLIVQSADERIRNRRAKFRE